MRSKSSEAKTHFAHADTYRSLVKQLGWSTLNVQLAGLNTFSKTDKMSNASSSVGRRLQQVEVISASRLQTDLVYAVAVAAILLGTIAVAHILINRVWWLVVKQRVADILLIPCAEVLIMGFVFVALSFYASIPLGPNVPTSLTYHGQASMTIHVAVCLPYLAFLLWMASQRNRMRLGPEECGQDSEHVPQSNAATAGHDEVSNQPQREYLLPFHFQIMQCHGVCCR